MSSNNKRYVRDYLDRRGIVSDACQRWRGGLGVEGLTVEGGYYQQ